MNPQATSSPPPLRRHAHEDAHHHPDSHRHPHAAAKRHAARPGFPPRSLLGAGLSARLAVAAGAVALLWLAILWALD